MKIISVNVGSAEPISTKSGHTGIFKKPQSSAIQIGSLGLENDVIVDTQNHGGPDQAVYLYGQPDYDWWASELNRPLSAGTFGENLTVSEFSSADMHIGDRFHIGDTILEVTSPRIPCVTLGVRMGDPKFPKAFLKAMRPGIYCRVLAQGKIAAGDSVTHVPFAGTQVGINDMLNYKNISPDEMRRQLETPIHIKSRANYEAKLAR